MDHRAEARDDQAVTSPLDVYVHIGAPKSGTTFVQNVLWSNRDRLAEDGVLYPYAHATEHFTAMLDLRQRGWGGIAREDVVDHWDRVAERVRAWDGHAAVLTNELLGGANVAQIRRLVDSVDPARVHIVYTARDLARQLVSAWQEQVKHNLAVTFEEFLDEMLDHGPDSRPRFGRQFWPLQDITHVLDRWSEVVGSDAVSVVTVQPPDADPSLLWERFCQATGLDSARYNRRVTKRNKSLTVPEAEFFRQVNAMAQIPPRDYTILVRNGLMRTIAKGEGAGLVLPEAYADRVRERARVMVKPLRQHTYTVVGDLEDLVPDMGHHVEEGSPAQVTDAELLPLAMQSVQALLGIASDQRAKIRELDKQVPSAGAGGESRSERAVARARAGVGRLKQRVARLGRSAHE